MVYVGVTSDLSARLRAHSRKWWWSTIDPRLSWFNTFPTRELAEEYEAELIAQRTPEINRAGRLALVTSIRGER